MTLIVDNLVVKKAAIIQAERMFDSYDNQANCMTHHLVDYECQLIVAVQHGSNRISSR